ncbi:MAG: hypothetical protein U0353_21880 [Sandaracinus sp.]
MNAHRAPSTLSLARNAALVLAFFAALVGVASPASAQQRSRAIVLSFEGWHADQARTAVADALATQYELVSEEQAINAAAQIAVDVSTPEGMASVVQHLGIELVVGGSVAGTGRRSSTTIFVLDRNGNQIGDATAPGPTGRAAVGPIGQAALQACATAMVTLHPPQPVVLEPVQTVEEPEQHEEEPPMRSLEEIENERPGDSRGQGGGGRRDFEEHHDDAGPTDGRWNQPVFRGMLQADLRNRSAVVVPFDSRIGEADFPRNTADFYPQWGVDFELRPMANNDDALRGLYAHLGMWFSAGISYFSVLDIDPLNLQVFGLQVDVGYAATLAEAVELIGSIGFGYDSYSLQLAQNIHFSDFPSTGYPYLPISVGGRIRLLPSSVSGVDLHLEVMGGPRILFGGGQLAGTRDSDDPETREYFNTRTGGGCPIVGQMCDGDFGGVSGAGINYAGLGLVIDPGFTAALRFQYTNYFLGFSNGAGVRAATSGNDESIHIQIMLGWSLR